MLQLLAEAALRSTILGGAALLGLKLMRVSHPQVQMTVWTVILVVSLATPVLTPWMTVTIAVQAPAAPLNKISWIELPGITQHVHQPVKGSAPEMARPNIAVPARPWWDGWQTWARRLYLIVSGAMLLRVLVGLAVMWRIIRAAQPVRGDWTSGNDVRQSDVVRVPATFASTILLPPGYMLWDARKLQAVLLHERSHVVHGDFYVLLLASIHRAVFWFSPFAWWLFAYLAALAEAVSDDMAVAGLGGDRNSYADILIGMAVAPQRLPVGLAMANPRTAQRRAARIRAEVGLPTKMDWRRRLRIAVGFLPVAAIGAVGVSQSTAAPQPGPIGLGAMSLERYVGQFQIGVGSVLDVTRNGDRLFAQWSGQPALEFIATGRDEFKEPLGDAQISFAHGQGPATELVLREPGMGPAGGTRIDTATAGELEAVFQQRMATAPDRFRDQMPTPGGATALSRTIDALRGDALNEQDLSPRLYDKLRQQLPMFHPSLAALGAVEQVVFRGVGPGGYDVYGVKFAHGTADFRIYVAAGGRLVDINFYPGGDGRPGKAEGCAFEPTLKASMTAIPIRLSLINRSGAEVQLYWLDDAGKRVPSGRIANNASMHIRTNVGRPYVVADLAGDCREIVLPGETTRFHVIEPSGIAETHRAAPRTGSDEALRQFIVGVRRGAPDYDQMTPEVQAQTRLYLSAEQAILEKLGALQDLTFRGVGPSGNDIYSARFANGSVTWQIGLLDEGRIAAVAPGPSY